MKRNEFRTCTRCKKRIFVSVSYSLSGELLETHFIGLKRIIDDHPTQDAKNFVCGSCKSPVKKQVKIKKKK